MKTLFIVSFFVCMMLIANIAWSEIVYVNGTTGDDATGERGNPDKPFKTIQKGIDVAVSGEDTVLVADGTYTGTGNKNLDFKGKAITVTSENGAENCIIDCEGDGRGFYFHSGETEESVVSGFTIKNGKLPATDSDGVGIYCENSSPTIEENIIKDNSTGFGFGGGIHCTNSSPTIRNNKVSGNSSISGGGIFCTADSSPIIQNNIIAENEADAYGGGIFCYRRSHPTIINNTINDNLAGQHGGGIYCANHSSPIIQNNIIGRNSTKSNGGGIYCESASPTIQNNKIIENSAADWAGGGIYCENASPMIINNNIAKNTVGGYGGGIYCKNASPTIINNNITKNVAGGDGGGIDCYYYSSPTIINSTITKNAAGSGGGGIDCTSSSAPTVLNTILWEDIPYEIYLITSRIDITYSDIQGGWEGEGNIDADPLFVDADNDIYYLQVGSPCLSSANCEGTPETDKDGHPRPLGSGCDMGSYEECDNGIFGYISSSNCDISAYDASLVLQSVVGLIDLSERQKIAADVTGDGTITALDVALILQYTVGLITQFPVQQGAPILTAKDENQILTKIIAELENVPLTAEQEGVLEQLKQLIWQQQLIPNHTTLLQNYPNPFNPETWLPYQLAQDASITIRIYNVKGRLIRTLVLGNKNAGVYMTKDKAAHWDGKDSLGQSVASGVYFYTLQVEVASLRSNLRQRNPDRDGTGTYTATRKMVILK